MWDGLLARRKAYGLGSDLHDHSDLILVLEHIIESHLSACLIIYREYRYESLQEVLDGHCLYNDELEEELKRPYCIGFREDRMEHYIQGMAMIMAQTEMGGGGMSPVEARDHVTPPWLREE